MKHISIRVAWHDRKWNGTVCKCPIQNTFCMQLKRIAEDKDANKENSVACKEWGKLNQQEMPVCIAEAGGFMNANKYKRVFTHVYSKIPDYPHTALEPTEDEVPAFSFYGTPYRYMLCENEKWLNEKYPNLPKDEKNPHSPWIFGFKRQRAILKIFREQIVENQSLVVFYTKNGNPIDEECQRLIIGLGKISSLFPIGEYKSKADYTYPFWDIKMSHTIRPNLKESDGFLLPYHEYLALDENEVLEKTGKTKDKCIDEIKLTLNKLGGSQQMLDQLSYGCEHVDNHNMLIILNAARFSLEKVIEHNLVGGDWQRQLRWIDDQIAKVKEQMGPFPAFAEALRVAGFNYSYMIEQDLRNMGFCKPKDNPWLLFEKLLSGELAIDKTAYTHHLKEYRIIWESTGSKVKKFLQLLSRINLTDAQIRNIYNNENSYQSVEDNPYILSEDCNTNIPADIITTEMLDESFMKDPSIQGNYPPLAPSLVESPIDKRRIRALIVRKLKNALNEGDTLLSETEIVDYLENYLDKKDNIAFTKGYLDAHKDFISEKLNYIQSDKGEVALQLVDYTEREEEVSKKFIARSKAKTKKEIKENWEVIVKSVIDNFDSSNKRSMEAIKDQARALDIMANYKLSVLTGPAGTGKTKVVEAFLKSSTIRNQGVLLLAPTGKARVRLAKMAGIEAFTIAQFLVSQNCFNPVTMTPQWTVGKSKRYSAASTIIIDECSMLTIDDFYFVFKALSLSSVERIILIGDPYQLPPIGPGRPFADLCNYLEKNRLNSLARLNIVVRTTTKGDSDILKLASWFSGMKPDKSADDIFNKMASGDLDNDLSVYTWKETDDLREKLCDVLSAVFGVNKTILPSHIEKLLGIDTYHLDNTFINPEVLESFQVLSPVRNPIWGTLSINSILQDILSIPSPSKKSIVVGAQKIYARDKVIQLINEKREAFKNGNKYSEQLSNGQIGFVRGNPRGIANVAFVGLPEVTFGFKSQDTEMKEASIELAYAITIHKSQGSDFDTVLVILPKTGRLLSRELIYTALTRSKKRLILFVEEDTNWIKSLSAPNKSVVALRNSNLFGSYAVRKKENTIPYVEGLIHQTKNGLYVRSKSEVIIANEIFNNKIEFLYEEPLKLNDGKICLPDFTFESESGDIIIWEHLGMLKLPNYKQRWEEKLRMYEENGFVLGEDLYTTEDSEDGAISTPKIIEVINKIKERMED